jgi:LytS/YehU family sensor histidine kinase
MKITVELEQLRFTKIFDFQLEISPEVDVKAVLIPPLLTQPFVENAIWHGLIPLQNRKGILKITIEGNSDFIFIQIEDNGIGREKTLKSEGETRSSKGIKLVQDRLTHLNAWLKKELFQMAITDLLDGEGQAAGTQVRLQLPKQIDENTDPGLFDG